MVSLLLVAASGLAREVLSIVDSMPDLNVVGLVDDDPSLRGSFLHGVPVVGPVAAVTSYPDTQLLICAGHGRVRSKIVTRLAALGITDERYATVIDESAHVPVSCAIGSGSIVFAHAVLTTDIEVGPHVVIMPNATLTHDNRISHYATICAGVSLGGAVEVGPAAYLGMNSSVRENLKIGATAVLGMGAVLLSDLPAGETWVGVPAAPVGLATKISPSPRNPHVQDALA